MTTALDGTILTFNRRFAEWSGRSEDDLRGSLRWKELLAPASKILYETHFVPVLEAQNVANEVAFDLLRPDGSRFPVLVCALRRCEDDEDAPVTTITVFDASETRRFEQALKKARREAEASAEVASAANRDLHAQHERLRLTLQSIADAVVTTDAEGRITSMNPTAESLSGISFRQASGNSVALLGRLSDPETHEAIPHSALYQSGSGPSAWSARLMRHDGEERYVDGSAATIRDEAGRIDGTVLVCRDVTQIRASTLRLAYEASHDHLTGLLNRREFERRIQQAAIARISGSAPDLLLYVDLDQFKIVNDTAGHTAGDQALVQVAKVLGGGLRQSDALARLGGDEFGVLLLQCAVEDGEVIAEMLRRRLEDSRFVCHGRVYGLTASIGLAVLSTEECRAGNAMSGADMACIAAKDAGRNRIHRFDLSDQALRHRRDEMSWVSKIRRGLDEDRFQLYFQPIVRVDGTPEQDRHGELLLRLQDEDGTILPPGECIAAAERYQQMGHIDRWVIQHAFGWLASVDHVRVSINVSGQSFGDAAFLNFVIGQFEEHPFEPSRICFEITETAAIADLPAALRFIEALRVREVRFALDDFGAGLSSFSYLKTLPVDYVKIDGSFVKTLLGDPVNLEIVESIHRIARRCRLQTVAEWVEGADVLDALRTIGVDYAQGWHVGRPEPIYASTRSLPLVASAGESKPIRQVDTQCTEPIA